jgi:hypothetical protein
MSNSEEIVRAVRSRIDVIRTSGSVWGSTERAIVHLLAGTEAERLFGRAGLTAAARRSVPACCAFGCGRLLAVKLDEPAPAVSPATAALLGRPCAGCLTEIAAEKAARDDVAGRRSRAARPATSTSALTASARAPRLDGPCSPDGWTGPAHRVGWPCWRQLRCIAGGHTCSAIVRVEASPLCRSISMSEGGYYSGEARDTRARKPILLRRLRKGYRRWPSVL